MKAYRLEKEGLGPFFGENLSADELEQLDDFTPFPMIFEHTTEDFISYARETRALGKGYSCCKSVEELKEQFGEAFDLLISFGFEVYEYEGEEIPFKYHPIIDKNKPFSKRKV